MISLCFQIPAVLTALEAAPARAPENIDTNDEFLFLHPELFSREQNDWTVGLPVKIGPLPRPTNIQFRVITSYNLS